MFFGGWFVWLGFFLVCLWGFFGFFSLSFFYNKQNLQIILIYLKRNYSTLSMKVACLDGHIDVEAFVRIQDLSICCAFFSWR